MTRFTGPLKVKMPFSETTVASIDISGSAKFSQGISSLKPVQVGSSAGTMGAALLQQTINLSAANTKHNVTLPDGADIVDVKFIANTPYAASAAATINVLVGTSADDTKFGQFTNVTAAGYYTLGNTVTSGWSSVSGANAVVVAHASAASGAIASTAGGRVEIIYVSRQ